MLYAEATNFQVLGFICLVVFKDKDFYFDCNINFW
jgi:hypothetical protein